jgi:TRAP-type C4-dicarboxylate transport system permease small subunit
MIGTSAADHFIFSVQMPLQGLKFARVVLHSLCTVFELGFFCWFGSEVMHKVTRLQLMYSVTKYPVVDHVSYSVRTQNAGEL